MLEISIAMACAEISAQDLSKNRFGRALRMASSEDDHMASVSSEAAVVDEFADESEVRGSLYFSAPVEVRFSFRVTTPGFV